jgi:hypothetical protein
VRGNVLVSAPGFAVHWPGAVNRAVAAVHPRFGTPWVATVVTGVVAALLCFADPKLLLVVTSTSIAALCLGALNGRRTGTTPHVQYRMPWRVAAGRGRRRGGADPPVMDVSAGSRLGGLDKRVTIVARVLCLCRSAADRVVKPAGVTASRRCTT